MSVSLSQAQALRRLAAILADFLPGSGHPDWRGHVSFQSLAREQGLSTHWRGGTKEPAVASLLERTYEYRLQQFEPLILAVVRNGLTYRQRQQRPILCREIDQLNARLLELGFKFPQLVSQEFIGGLAVAETCADTPEQEPPFPHPREAHDRALVDLCQRLYGLSVETNRQAAGLAFERLLTDIFGLFDLDPRGGFRVVGEQIDGSFILDANVYLVEAKWTESPTSEQELLVFRGKIEGKSAFTRGVFITLNGCTAEAYVAITKGKQPTFFILDGYDLSVVLQGFIELPKLLRRKLRKLSEEGLVFVSATTLLDS